MRSDQGAALRRTRCCGRVRRVGELKVDGALDLVIEYEAKLLRFENLPARQFAADRLIFYVASEARNIVRLRCSLIIIVAAAAVFLRSTLIQKYSTRSHKAVAQEDKTINLMYPRT